MGIPGRLRYTKRGKLSTHGKKIGRGRGKGEYPYYIIAMAYAVFLKYSGLAMLFFISAAVLTGLRIIKVDKRIHKAAGYMILLLATGHGIYAWLRYFPNSLLNIISGTAIFLLASVNIFLWRKRLIKLKAHKHLGLTIFVIAIMHGIYGIIR
jgi:hypothetical protein